MNIRTQLQSLPRPFWVLVGATFVNRFGVFVVPFLALFITRNGNSAAQAGCAIAACSVGSFGAAWLGGWLADRLGRNFTMALSALAGAVCMLTMSPGDDWSALAVIAFITGAVNEAGHPAGSAHGMPLYDHHPDLLWAINATLGLLVAALILSKRGNAATIT